MELHKKIDLVNSKEQLAAFVGALREELLTNPEAWENPSLESFLEAMEAWILAMENLDRNTDRELPVYPSWSVFAQILYAARSYE
jgi:hypothetical protein